MASIIKKINWKLLNIAFYITLIVSYFYPCRLSVNNSIKIGFPFSYFSIYTNIHEGYNLFSSCHVFISGFIIDVLFYFVIISVIAKIFTFIKVRRKNNEKNF